MKIKRLLAWLGLEIDIKGWRERKRREERADALWNQLLEQDDDEFIREMQRQEPEFSGEIVEQIVIHEMDYGHKPELVFVNRQEYTELIKYAKLKTQLDWGTRNILFCGVPIRVVDSMTNHARLRCGKHQ
jgi:hypothetical protein